MRECRYRLPADDYRWSAGRRVLWRASTKIINHWAAVTRFLDDLPCPATIRRQSASPRTLPSSASTCCSPVATQAATEGAHRARVLLGIIATCCAPHIPTQGPLDLGLRATWHPSHLRPPRREDHVGRPQGRAALTRVTPGQRDYDTGSSPSPHPGVVDRSRLISGQCQITTETLRR